jgi:sortase A
MTLQDTAAPRSGAIPTQRARPALGLRVARGVGWAMIWLGLLTLGFVVHQLWVTSWLAELNQGKLSAEVEERFVTAEITTVAVEEGGTIVEPGADPPRSAAPEREDIPEPQMLLVESAPEPHSAFAIVRIPTIGRLQEGWNVVSGVRVNDLKTGAGHMPDTPLPGQPGNAVISGHRTTYGQPFHELDMLTPGDRIEVETALGTHVYAVRAWDEVVVANPDLAGREVEALSAGGAGVVVRPNATWVTGPIEGGWLTLTTCHPRFSASRRLIVFAEMVDGPNIAAIEGAS